MQCKSTGSHPNDTRWPLTRSVGVAGAWVVRVCGRRRQAFGRGGGVGFLPRRPGCCTGAAPPAPYHRPIVRASSLPLAAFSAPLVVLAVAFPFLFAVTQPPSTNFWPLMASGGCAGVVLVAWMARPPGGAAAAGRAQLADWVGAGLVLAALLASAIGLLQYFGAASGLEPWVHPASPGQAMGNLRQRNQQATLLSMGLWALWWAVARLQAQTRGAAALPVPGWLAGVLLAWALVLLAAGSAATASRTGLVQWGVMFVLVLLWRASMGWLAAGLVALGLALYALAAWLLPELLQQWTGFQAQGLYARFAEGSACSSRRALWSNVLYLIGQKPWLGWGWGELDYAHYITLFPGVRFCALLDNAHNLPLHLAVELGVPLAVLACMAVLVWVWSARPWREADPARQLAWGLLALVGVHSMLEFPLWYGPFQLVTVLAVCILWRRPAPGRVAGFFKQNRPLALIAKALAAIVVVAFMGYASWDYSRVSQVYKPVHLRSPGLQQDTLAQVSDTWLFAHAVQFAILTTTPVTPDTAQRMHALALGLLHYSPEPRVIEPLIESAVLLGRDDEAAFHLQRYRVAYPADHARWQKKNAAAGGEPLFRNL